METVAVIAGIWAGALAIAVTIEMLTRPHGGPR